MAIAYQSVGTGAWVGASSVVITKPTGLAVGDLMVAIIGNDNAGTANINTPSGWTSYANSTGTGAGDDPRLAVFYKIADSSDVAASDFTFTQTAAVRIAGAILRIDGYGFFDQTAVTNIVTAGNISTAAGVTPTRANELLLIMVLSEDASGNDATYSGYAIATSNPSWTESFELNDAGDTGTLACAVAVRPETTATGNISITVGGSPGVNTEHIVRIISIAPQVNGSITPDPTKLNAYALSPIPKTELDAIVEDPTTREGLYTGWTNPDKGSTTWTNPNK